MKFFVTGVNGQLGHDVMNELHKRGHEGVGSDIALAYAGVADGSAVTTMPYVGLDITDKENVELAKTDHLLWRARISQILWGNIDLDASNVRDHTTCRLGRWSATKGRELFGNQPEFQKLEKDHARFHACCAEAIDAYHGKNKKLVDNLTEELSALSATVIGSLDELKNKL